MTMPPCLTMVLSAVWCFGRQCLHVWPWSLVQCGVLEDNTSMFGHSSQCSVEFWMTMPPCLAMVLSAVWSFRRQCLHVWPWLSVQCGVLVNNASMFGHGSQCSAEFQMTMPPCLTMTLSAVWSFGRQCLYVWLWPSLQCKGLDVNASMFGHGPQCSVKFYKTMSTCLAMALSAVWSFG